MMRIKILKNMTKETLLMISAGVVLAVILVIYSFLWLNSCAPITEHWQLYYVVLAKRGLLPYRDFYYYLPPLNFIIDYFLWSFSFGKLIIYTCFRLIERIIMAEVIYLELSRYFDWKKAWLATLCGMILATANVYDLFGDYTQSSTFLIVLLMVCAIRFAEKMQKKYLIWAGLFLALEFLMKQNVFIAVTLVFFVALIVYCMLKRDKFFFLYIGNILIGFCPVILVAFGIMAVNGMFFPFLEQVYLGVDSKGSIWHIVFDGLEGMLRRPLFMVLSLALFLIVFFSKRRKRGLTVFTTISFILIVFANYGEQIKKVFAILWKYGTLYLIVSFILAFIAMEFLAYKRIISADRYNVIRILLILCVFAALIYLACSNSNIIAKEMYGTTGAFELLDQFDDILWGVACLCGIYLIDKRRLELLMFTVAAFALAYSTAMSNGAGSAVCAYVLLAPVVLVFLTSVKSRFAKFRNYSIYFIAVLCCFLCMCQKVVCPYAWWGCTSYPLSERTEKMDSKFLAGYRLTEEEKNKYEVLSDVINKNSSNDSVVWGYPNVTIFNFLTDHYDMNGFVPIPWYDVCSTEYAKAEAELLRENEPDIVVWCDIPGAIEVHESMYLQGNQLGQREIIRWFASASLSDYKLIGQMDNIFIYKLIKDGKGVSHEYIQDPLRENVTLNMGY